MLLLRYSKLIAACTLLGLIASTLFVTLKPPAYKADAEILIDSRGIPALRDTNENYTLDSSQIETHMVNLKSRTLAESVITELKLIDDPDFAPAARAAEPGRQMSLAINAFRNRLDVSRNGISYVINVSFSASDAEKAALIANATANAYLHSLIDVRSEVARASSEWLEGQISKLRVQMNAANRKAQLAKASQDYRITDLVKPDAQNPKADGKVVDERPSLEEMELLAATYRKVYEHSLNTLTELVQRESYPVTNVRIISRALPPGHRNGVMKLILLGGVLGAALGLAFGIIKQLLSGA